MRCFLAWFQAALPRKLRKLFTKDLQWHWAFPW